MKSKRTGLFLAAGCLSLTVLTGCSTEDTRNYKQAAQDLENGNYEDAITDFSNALACEKVGKKLKKDILSYRAAAYLKTKAYDEAYELGARIAE